MAIRERGGMWCPTCRRSVAARKNGHAVRNAGGLLGAVPTLGLSLLATKSEQWHCPNCGGPVKYGPGRVALQERELPATGPVTVTLMHHGRQKIQAVRIYRKTTGAGLKEALAAIEVAPTVVGSFNAQEAERLVLEFERQGCTAVAEDTTVSDAMTPDTLAADLQQLADMHSAGALTAEEFATAKAQRLGT